MSRSGYSDDCDDIWLYRQAVENAIKGKRGQAFFRGLVEALDAMPEKRLIASAFNKPEGCCALGALGRHKGVDLSDLEPAEEYGEPEHVNHRAVAKRFDIARSLSAEVQFMNDEWDSPETPEQRWQRMRRWAAANLRRGQ